MRWDEGEEDGNGRAREKRPSERVVGDEGHARSLLHGNGRGVGVKMGMNVEMGCTSGRHILFATLLGAR